MWGRRTWSASGTALIPPFYNTCQVGHIITKSCGGGEHGQLQVRHLFRHFITRVKWDISLLNHVGEENMVSFRYGTDSAILEHMSSGTYHHQIMWGAEHGQLQVRHWFRHIRTRSKWDVSSPNHVGKENLHGRWSVSVATINLPLIRHIGNLHNALSSLH